MSQIKSLKTSFDHPLQEPLILQREANEASVIEAVLTQLSLKNRLVVIEGGEQSKKTAFLAKLGAQLVISGYGRLLRLRGNQSDFLSVLSEQLRLTRYLPLEKAIESIPFSERYVVVVENAEMLAPESMQTLRALTSIEKNADRVAVILYSEAKESGQTFHIKGDVTVAALGLSEIHSSSYVQKVTTIVDRLKSEESENLSSAVATKRSHRKTPSQEQLVWSLAFLSVLGLAIVAWTALLSEPSENKSGASKTNAFVSGAPRRFVPEPLPEESIAKHLSSPRRPYVNQLFGTWTEERAEAFIKEHQLEKIAQIKIAERLQRPWYIVVLGEYEHVEDAEFAISQLPKEVRTHNPWVRSMQVKD